MAEDPPIPEDTPESSEPKLRVISGASNSLSPSPFKALPHYCLDALDHALLAHLAEDGRKALLSIAAELGVDEKTLRYRIGKLREAGVLQFAPIIQPNRISGCSVVYLGIRLKPDGRKEIEASAEAISQLPQVNWCGAVMGSVDLFAEVVLDSVEGLREFQLNILSRCPEIETSESLVVLSHHGPRGLALTPKSWAHKPENSANSQIKPRKSSNNR